IDCFRHAIQIKPQSAAVRNRLADAESNIRQYRNAMSSYEAGLALAPDDIDMLVGLALTRLWTAEWHDHAPLIRKIKQAMQEGRMPGTPAKGHALLDDPAIHYKCSRHYSSHYSGRSLKRLFPQASPHKIRVAYISGDFRVHPVSLLAAGLFEHHNKNRFELFAFAWDCDDSDLRRRIQAAFDQFVDISDASDERAAGLIRD